MPRSWERSLCLSVADIGFASARSHSMEIEWACKRLEKYWASVLYLGILGKQLQLCSSQPPILVTALVLWGRGLLGLPLKGNLWSDARMWPGTGAGCFCPVCGRICIYCKVGTRSKLLLKLTCVKIQISGVVCSRDWPAMKGRRSVTLGWVPLRYRWNRANTKAKILLAEFP